MARAIMDPMMIAKAGKAYQAVIMGSSTPKR